MTYHSTIESLKANKKYSILLFHYDYNEYRLSDIVRIMEENEGLIKSMEIKRSDKKDHNILIIYLKNEDISDIVIKIEEKELIDIQGINRKVWHILQSILYFFNILIIEEKYYV